MKVWLNGKIIDARDAKVSLFDRGFLYGDGVFETMRAYGGAVFMLEDHLARLKGSLALCRISIGRRFGAIAPALERLLEMNRLKEASVRVNVSRGEGRFGIGAKDRPSPTVAVTAQRFLPLPRRMHERGISAGIVRDVRLNGCSPLSGIKSSNYLLHIIARMEAEAAGFDEAILLNARGVVAEAATSNIFAVCGRKVVTPPLAGGILPGVTRKAVLALAGACGFSCEEKEITRRALGESDEVFLTNSLFEILPVTSIDRSSIGDGKVGPVTALLRGRYRKLARRGTEAPTRE